MEGSLLASQANNKLVKLLKAAPTKSTLKIPRCLIKAPPISAPKIVIMTPNILETVAISFLEKPISK